MTKVRPSTPAARILLARASSFGFNPGLCFGAKALPSLTALVYSLIEERLTPKARGYLALALATLEHRLDESISLKVIYLAIRCEYLIDPVCKFR